MAVTPLTVFFIKQGDTLEPLQITLLKSDPENAGQFIPITRDLTDAQVEIHMRTADGLTLLIAAGAGAVLDPTTLDPPLDVGTPVVGYAWQAGDTDVATRKASGAAVAGVTGPHQLEAQVTYSDGGVETFPNTGNISVHITEQIA